MKSKSKLKGFFTKKKEDMRRLMLIASRINHHTLTIKRSAFDIGKLLIEAKEIVGHGNFKDWVNKNCDFSYPTAVNFMNVYKCCIGIPEIVETIKPSILYEIASPKFPKDLRAYLFEHHNHLDNINNRKVREVCTLYKAGEIDLDSPEIKGLVKFNEDSDSYADFCQDKSEYMHELKQLKKKVASLVDRTKKCPYINLSDHERIGDKDYSDEKVSLLSKDEEKEIEQLIIDLQRILNFILPEQYIVAEDHNIKPALNAESLGSIFNNVRTIQDTKLLSMFEGLEVKRFVERKKTAIQRQINKEKGKYIGHIWKKDKKGMFSDYPEDFERGAARAAANAAAGAPKVVHGCIRKHYPNDYPEYRSL